MRGSPRSWTVSATTCSTTRAPSTDPPSAPSSSPTAGATRPRGHHPPAHRTAHRASSWRPHPRTRSSSTTCRSSSRSTTAPATTSSSSWAADDGTRVNRLMHTRGMTEADARSRIAAQANDEQRRAAADVWLDNEAARTSCASQWSALWRERLVPFEENVRRGIRSPAPRAARARRPGPHLAGPGRTGPRTAASAFGDTAVTADHMGSTAVPGLVAKDVLDVQIGVHSLGGRRRSGSAAATHARRASPVSRAGPSTTPRTASPGSSGSTGRRTPAGSRTSTCARWGRRGGGGR